MADDRWFQAELSTRAASCVAKAKAPAQWAEDVAHHALLMLANRLRGSGYLGVDVERARETFAAWLGSIVDGLCDNALQYLFRLHRAPPPACRPRRQPPDKAARDLAFDLTMAINQLALLPRSLVQLRLEGHSLAKAAAKIGLTRKRARAIYTAARAQWRRELKAYRLPGDS